MTPYFPFLLWFYIIMFALGMWGRNRAVPIYEPEETNGKCYINIVCVEYEQQPYAYATVADKKRGEHAEYLKGLRPTVTFSLMNMSDKNRMVAIPNYFYIFTDFFDKHKPEGTHYENRCNCYVADHAGEPGIPDGADYTSVTDVVHGKAGDKYTLPFGPWEVKKFTVPFYGAMFPENEENFRFCGFTHVEPFTKRKADLAFDIDIATGKAKHVESLHGQ